MTLGGLALAVGILVDESTVVMENIHSHLDQGRGRAVAVLEASKEVQIPRLLAMLCVLAVFVPSFFMVGVARSLFVPLSLAVGFAMAASYSLSSSLVPVLSTWILRDARPEHGKQAPSLLDRLRETGLYDRCVLVVTADHGISFKTGGIITCFMGIAMMPWKMLADHRTFIFGWLGGYAAVLGPVAGIMICDFYLVRSRRLVVNDLYLRDGEYEYSRGFNWRALTGASLPVRQVRSL